MLTFIVVLFFLCTHGCVAAAGGDVGCSIPSVKEGEQSTLTCSFHNVNVTDTTIIVNAKIVEIAHPESVPGGDLSVLFLTNIDQDNPMQVVDPNYQLLNFSVSGKEAELRILIPDAKRRYAGTYTCQAMRKDNTHAMQSCRFLLDRVKVEVLNSSSVLLMVNDSTGDDNLIQAITVRREEMDKAPRKIELSPPQSSYIVSALDENTEYVLKVYMGQDRIPVDRDVCIPAVRKLTGQCISQGNSSVLLNWEPTTCSRGPLPFVYQVCYTKLNTEELSTVSPDHCLITEKPRVLVQGLDANIRYTFGVRAIIDPAIEGQLVTLELCEAEKEDNAVTGLVIGITVASALLVAPASLLIWYYKKRSNKCKKDEVNFKTLNGDDMEVMKPFKEAMKTETKDLGKGTAEDEGNSEGIGQRKELTVYKGQNPVMTELVPEPPSPGPSGTIDLHSSRENPNRLIEDGAKNIA